MQIIQRQTGFTLIEILIVVVIVAILASIAVPSYRDYAIRSKRAVGAAELLEAQSLQEQYFLNNKQYATDLSNLGYSANPYYINDEGEDSGAGGSIYKIQLSGASTSAFTLQAVPQNGQVDDTADCGTLSITNLGQRGKTGSKTVSECW